MEGWNRTGSRGMELKERAQGKQMLVVEGLAQW